MNVDSTFAAGMLTDGPGAARLAVAGEIDADVSDALTAIIAEAAGRAGVPELVVDLHRVSFLAAAGVHALVAGREAALREECGFRVVNAHGIVERVLRITGLEVVLDLCGGPDA
jgi:anti-anti-sigma factor